VAQDRGPSRFCRLENEFDSDPTSYCSADEKTLNDPFAGTDLKAMLEKIAPDRLLISGWATDLCVDATVRSAVSNRYDVIVVANGHTVSDRPHLDARAVIGHHNWVWGNLITDRLIRLASAAELLREIG
jgi:nicotinamidase-related amidase